MGWPPGKPCRARRQVPRPRSAWTRRRRPRGRCGGPQRHGRQQHQEDTRDIQRLPPSSCLCYLRRLSQAQGTRRGNQFQPLRHLRHQRRGYRRGSLSIASPQTIGLPTRRPGAVPIWALGAKTLPGVHFAGSVLARPRARPGGEADLGRATPASGSSSRPCDSRHPGADGGPLFSRELSAARSGASCARVRRPRAQDARQWTMGQSAA
mmetsp:Transcript_108509/g.338204  ORF Transcript_108509/g.338204 Transcript_108509/m.338204 type:complete len:208 (-) Transcript_108509:75-698(-)